MQQTQQTKIRVLIGDTSVRSRLVLSGMIDAEPQLEVVDTAQSKEELLLKAMSSKPDLIVAHYGLTNRGKLPLFMPLYGEDSSMMLMVSHELAESNFAFTRKYKVREQRHTAAKGSLSYLGTSSKFSLISVLRAFVVNQTAENPIKSGAKELFIDPKLGIKRYSPSITAGEAESLAIIVIGASTGGSAAIEYLIRDLDVSQPCVVLIAVHMPEKFTKRLAHRLQKLTTWRVEEGYQDMKLTSGTVVIAPGGYNMRVKRKAIKPNHFTLDLEPALALDSPSVDALMQSAALCAQEKVLGVILTGMGQDGTAGARYIGERGGVVIAQNEDTSTIFGMAKSAIENKVVHGVYALGQINSIMKRFVTDRHLSHALQQNYTG